MNDESKKMWNKINLNTFYPPTSTDCFYMYDANLAAKIAEEGQELLEIIDKNIKFEKRKRIIGKLMGKNLDN